MDIFSARLKWLRERMNITQKEMAERIGVSQQYYNKFEKGTGQPNLETLYKIRVITEESLDFLIGYYFEDRKATELFMMYSEFRSERTLLEEMIDHASLNIDEHDHDAQGMEARFKLLKHYQENYRELKIKEERAFNNFFEYISHIPGFDGEISTREYWITIYDYYKDDDDLLLSKEFRDMWNPEVE